MTMKKDTLNRNAYPTDFTEWTVIAPLLECENYSKREFLNGELCNTKA